MRLRGLRNVIRSDLDTATERGRLVRTAGMTAGLKIGATVLAFGASLLYARALGPHDYGLYAYVLAWVAVLTVPVGLGLPEYLVREGAQSSKNLLQLCRWSDRWVLATGLVAALIMALAFFLPEAAGSRWLFIIAAPLPLLNNLGSIRAAVLQAVGRITHSQWPILILAPATMLAAMVSLWFWNRTLESYELIAAMVGAAALSLFVNEFQFRRAAPVTLTTRLPAIPHARMRLRSALPFMWLGGLYLINSRIDLIMLGTLKGAHEAGVYAVTARAAVLVAFFLGVSNMVIAPRIALLHQQGNQVALQRLLDESTKRVMILSIPIALLFIFSAKPLLAYLYGADYVTGAAALQILAGAQLAHVAAGPTGTILNMTGHERLSALGIGLSIVLNFILNAVLIPLYGIEGAAIATGVSLVAWNTLFWYWIRRRLGLHSNGFRIARF